MSDLSLPEGLEITVRPLDWEYDVHPYTPDLGKVWSARTYLGVYVLSRIIGSDGVESEPLKYFGEFYTLDGGYSDDLELGLLLGEAKLACYRDWNYRLQHLIHSAVDIEFGGK